MPKLLQEKSFYQEVFEDKDGAPDWETYKARVTKEEAKCCRPMVDMALNFKKDDNLFEFNVEKKEGNQFCHFHNGYCSEKKPQKV